jgi:chromosome segregation ATPase
MPPAKKSFLRDNVALVSSMIPVLAIIIAGFSYVFSMANNVSTSKKEIQAIQEQLAGASRILSVNNYGEHEIEARINSVEYHIYENQESQILDIITRLLLIDEAIQDLRDTQNGTNHYLYSMTSENGGVQASLNSIKTQIVLLEQSVDSVHSDHFYFLDVLEEIEDNFDIRLSKPPDVYSGNYGGSYGR